MLKKDKTDMTDIAPVKKYFSALTRFDRAEATEHTLRSALEELLKAFAEKAEKKDRVGVIHEPRPDKSGLGAPDFKIKSQEMIVGYLETKRVGEDLDAVLASEQIAKYKKLSHNIILTDYVEWVWLRDGEEVKRERLCRHGDVGKHNAKLSPESAECVAALLENFLSTPPKGIGRAKDLAQALAVRCHELREFLAIELQRQIDNDKVGKLCGLYGVFKGEVFAEMKVKEFADTFAQTLGYGLFLAKLGATDEENIKLYNAKKHISANFPLIKELVGFLDELENPEYADIRWLVEEILSIINGLDTLGLREDISLAKAPPAAKGEEEKELFHRDPYVYFYEDFLKAYDRKMRQARGVYYTPPPVVKFIIRAINDILKETLGKKSGLASSGVTVLDFATGTGTFLLEALQQMFGAEEKSMHKKLVQDHVLKNFYGFEYLMAPYVVAHIKLSEFLREQGCEMGDKERLQIYLTNTIEPSSSRTTPLLPALSDEVKKAQEIKEKQVLVITGNPPYSGRSRNRGEWITDQIRAYHMVDGAPIEGENLQWLQDDYVKFIRFAQWKMANFDEGIVGVITNNSFLDALTFRGMRHSLMQTFNQMYVLNLHGNPAEREDAPQGVTDENVFDITQGVAISLFIKKKGLEKGIYHADLWGQRLSKYRTLWSAEKGDFSWEKVSALSPSYLFVPQNDSLQSEYDRGWCMTDIFPLNSSGIVTARDKMAIDFDKDKVLSRANIFRRSEKSNADLCRDLDISLKKGWNIDLARKNLRKEKDMECHVNVVARRPFDARFIFYHDSLVWTPARRVMSHFLGRDNIGIAVPRQVRVGNWRHCLVTSSIMESTYLSSRSGEIGYLFPLYRYLDDDEGGEGMLQMGEHSQCLEREPNISKKFVATIKKRYNRTFAPEEILGYVYAILHSQKRREKFSSVNRRQFPRITLVEGVEKFKALSDLGAELVHAHLPAFNLTPPPPPPDFQCEVSVTSGCFFVERNFPEYDDARLHINRTQYFSPVPQDVWEFEIGSYQVLKKYLMERRGRTLSRDEIENVKTIIATLRFTLAQMAEIDKTLGDEI